MYVSVMVKSGDEGGGASRGVRVLVSDIRKGWIGVRGKDEGR